MENQIKNKPDNKEGEEPWEVGKDFLNTKSTNHKKNILISEIFKLRTSVHQKRLVRE